MTLDWSDIADWGIACSEDHTYQVFVDTVPDPTTIYSTIDGAVSSDYFIGELGETYYWKIRAHNGSVYTDSLVRSFTIVENQISGTVYIDPDGTCSQGSPGNLGGALGLVWEDDSVSVSANGSYTLTMLATFTNHIHLPACASLKQRE